eukprot:TRINITY_DN3125_c0_g1_i13.p1 TRINITY_DN3125_c0_g1~~TRINITY_DN3125_c0_g1_i13.p1  ORF type:complete len:787 (+),score=252.61 TRINITY_DN3125_c0_g1_i13:53-2413(+)
MDGEKGTCRRGCVHAAMEYIRQHMRRDGDTEKDVQKKAVWVVFMAVCCVVSFVPAPIYNSALPFGAAFSAIALWPWVQGEVTEPYLRVATAVFCVTVCYYDALGQAAGRGQWWPLFVLLIDILLVVEAPRYLTKCVVGVVLLWLILMQIEFATRALGILDLPDMASYEARREQCNCDKPPCSDNYGVGAVAISLTAAFLIFLVDFFLTRGFADQAHAEKSKMAAAVRAAEDMARSLAGFDLDAAAAYLEEHPELPGELTQPFEALLANLRSYRPYLPGELFQKAAGSDAAGPCDGDAAVPGLVDRKVALVFTDIRSSSALWEYSSGAAMEKALNAHNDALRGALAAHDGYEIKTIGDAFFISFAQSISALRFGHAGQTALGAMKWPEGLTRPDADDGFAMLSVRMGIHCGEAVVQQNALTHRWDYFGPAVNKAARVEPFGAPGAVTVTAEVVADVGGEAVLAEEGFIVVPYAEERTGKGLRAPLVLTALIPQEGAEGIEQGVRALVGQRNDVASSRSSTPTSCWSERTSVSATSSRSACLRAVASAGSRVFRAASHKVFSATVAEGACVGVIRFTTFDLDGAHRICDPDAGMGEVARTEHRLQVLHTAVQMTRGHVTSVVSGTAWVSWGLQTQCAQYVNESSRCMAVLREKLAGEHAGGGAASFHAGLVTGPLATVELAASSGGRRYVTLLGACVELADALCGEAAATGAWVLAAAAGAEVGDGHAQMKEARRVEGWRTSAGGKWDIEAYELHLEALVERWTSDNDPRRRTVTFSSGVREKDDMET